MKPSDIIQASISRKIGHRHALNDIDYLKACCESIQEYLDEQYEKAQDSNKNILNGHVIRCKSCGNFSGINYEPIDFWRCHCGWEYDKNNKVKEPVWPEKKRCRHPSLCGPNGDCDNCAHNKAIADCIKAWKDAQG